ncbi:MAG TPA: 16S rRNA (cytidine(1402)-2'-O)-methyltransferase [Vicinamibacterales bacterium]|nr:16S rRNA (cytidine(1402)-2'-O)-methyltransferase [Vicinamibacterales bacterium]
MAGILYVVATPIGNLEDVTLRALRILRDVSLIAAEDTRRTARLLQHYSISTRTTSLHEHNEREKTTKLIERLRGGESIALVSDAGTPLISDPGQMLVAAARDAGIRVEAVPGPSAVMAAVSASGLPAAPFTFLGFPPNRSKDRAAWFDILGRQRALCVFFEAPHRFRQALDDLERVFGPDHHVGVGRELTKAHEELVIRPIHALRAHFIEPKGEFVLLVPPAKETSVESIPLPSAAELRIELWHITETTGAKGRGALKILAERYGRPVNALYELIAADRNRGHKT